MMTINVMVDDRARRFTGWVGVIGSVMSAACLVSYLAAVDGNMAGMFDPAFALGLSPGNQALFRFSQLADCFGFYLPYLVAGGYLWTRLRAEEGPLMDIAVLFIVVYALLGLAGAVVPLATLVPLSQVHAAGLEAAKAAAEATWLAVIHGAQNGLWWMEGPVLGFWALAVGRALRRRGSRLGSALMLIGIAFMVFFVLLFLGFTATAQTLELVLLPFLVIWQFLSGLSVLRGEV